MDEKEVHMYAEVDVEMVYEIPREDAARMTPQELRRELAIYLYQQSRISFGKAREMAGMTVWAFQQLLASKEIPVHYDVEDYEEDLTIFQKWYGLKWSSKV